MEALLTVTLLVPSSFNAVCVVNFNVSPAKNVLVVLTTTVKLAPSTLTSFPEALLATPVTVSNPCTLAPGVVKLTPLCVLVTEN